ncbi:MAG: hypothetical protein LBR15_06770 [Methanobrevibacter sp.]|nr:hypothetical protein [Candidatus Methanovirga australis]
MKYTAKLFKNEKSEIFLNSHASLENKRRIKDSPKFFISFETNGTFGS